jgi:hypothetical protein
VGRGNRLGIAPSVFRVNYTEFEQRLVNVDRFEVIDHRAPVLSGKPARVLVVHDAIVQVTFQDDGHTLKVFLSDDR